MPNYSYRFDAAAERGFRARQPHGSSCIGFDQKKLPPRVTAIRGGVEVKPVQPVASQAVRTGSLIRRPAVAKVVAVEKVPIKIVQNDTIELVAAQALLLSVLRSRQAVLEREESVRQAAEAEQIRVEAEKAERVRCEAEAAELRKEQERLAREEAVLRDERGRLIEAFRVVDIAVFALLWPETVFTRERVLSWVRTLGIVRVREMQWLLTDKIAIHAAVKAQAEAARRKAEADAAKLNPKKKGFDINAYLQAQANAADPVVPVRSLPSRAELGELERKVNGLPPLSRSIQSSSGLSGGKAGFVRREAPSVKAQASPRELLEVRIRALDATIVARVYQGNNTRWRWPNIEAMLAVSSEDEANQKLSEFADKVEHAMAKAKRKG